MKKLIFSILFLLIITSCICSSAVDFPINYFDSFEANHNDATLYNWNGKIDLLYTLEFGTDTKWPADQKMPDGFKKADRVRIMEFGKNPGLGIKKLQALGYTGKGVSVAIVDQPLLMDHIEYKDRDIHYYKINPTALKGIDSSSHGPGMTSILVGKNTGVVPESTLYFCANPTWLGDQKNEADAFEKIIELNKKLPAAKKIRVISLSHGVDLRLKNHELLEKTIEKAKKSGIIVIDVSTLPLALVACLPFKDKDNPANYQITKNYNYTGIETESRLFVPTGGKTIANGDYPSHYFYQTNSGVSSAVPYIAGVVAMGLQVDPSLTQEKAMRYLMDSGYEFYKGKLINPIGFMKMVEENVEYKNDPPKGKPYRYFLYNKDEVDSNDMEAVQKYIAKFQTNEESVLVDTSAYSSATDIYKMLKESTGKRTGIPKGIQIFGTTDDVPAFEIRYKIKLKNSVDEGGIFKSDHFYSSFNSSDLYDGISIFEIFEKKLHADFLPEWPVARLPLSKGEYSAYMKKYDDYTAKIQKKAPDIVDFSSPIFPQKIHSDDTGVLLDKMSTEFKMISNKSYRSYGNLQGLYPVNKKVAGDFSKENLKKENTKGICHFFINSHGQSDNIDQYIVDKNQNLGKYPDRVRVNPIGKSQSEFRRSLVNMNNINTVLSKNYYNLFSRSCSSAYELNGNNLIHEAMAKGKLVNAIANSSVNANNGIDVNADLKNMKNNNPAYNYMVYMQSLANGNSLSFSFYSAKRAYAREALNHKELDNTHGNYQFQLHNVLTQSFLGLLEYGEDRDFYTLSTLPYFQKPIKIAANENIQNNDKPEEIRPRGSINNRIFFEDNGLKFDPISTGSVFVTPGYILLELSAAVDQDNLYVKVRYTAPKKRIVVLHLGGNAPELYESYDGIAKQGDNSFIIRFGKNELEKFTAPICIEVGDDHSIVLDKELTDRLMVIRPF